MDSVPFGYVDMADALRIHTIYTAFSRAYDTSYDSMGERHNFWELVIVTGGRIGVTADRDVLILEAGQAILHEPMEFHRLWTVDAPNPSVIIFTFGADHMPAPASRIFRVSDLSVPHAVLEKLLGAFHAEQINIVSIREGCRIPAQMALKALESYILELLSQKPLQYRTPSRSAKHYAAIVKVLENNIDRSLSVPDIAALCRMSPVNLKQTFSRYAGMGVMEYYNRLKIQAAIPMLKSGMTVQEVANLLGFSSQNYFSTVFKRIQGQSPSHYK